MTNQIIKQLWSGRKIFVMSRLPRLNPGNLYDQMFWVVSALNKGHRTVQVHFLGFTVDSEAVGKIHS